MILLLVFYDLSLSYANWIVFTIFLEIVYEDKGLCGSSKLKNNFLVTSFDKFLILFGGGGLIVEKSSLWI